MNRRVESNHALAYAVDIANEWNLPVLFYEGLTRSYPQANDRFHTFLLEGVPETERRLRVLGIGYVFHLRRRRSDSNDALYRLAADAAALVTDDYPVFVARDHNRSVPDKLAIPYFAVDSSCIVPMSHFTKQEYAAYRFVLRSGRCSKPACSRCRRCGSSADSPTRCTPYIPMSPQTIFPNWLARARSTIRFRLLPKFAAAATKPSAVSATSSIMIFAGMRS